LKVYLFRALALSSMRTVPPRSWRSYQDSFPSLTLKSKQNSRLYAWSPRMVTISFGESSNSWCPGLIQLILSSILNGLLTPTSWNSVNNNNSSRSTGFLPFRQQGRHAASAPWHGTHHSATGADPRKGKGKTRVQHTMHMLGTT
jgi:hypothetical protein